MTRLGRSMGRSAEIMARAVRVLPGGVSSPVRAFAAVGGSPPVFRSATGAYLTDEDGNSYVDYVLAYGPHILGHLPAELAETLARQLVDGIAFGGPTALEVGLAERIVDAMPAIEMVRFVNSGTEATMSAVRLARAATGRDRIVMCAGGYHGHADGLLAAAGSGMATLGIAGSPGVPAHALADTTLVPYNDATAIEAVLRSEGERVAAVIVEPVAGNMGCVPPSEGYLDALRIATAACGALLIFDEVMTGFRVAYGGAQGRYGVIPDLTCLGKVIGGGLPVGAYGGRRDLMELVAPAGPVYQAGTLSGNPLAMAAGCAALDGLRDGAVYERLEAAGRRLGEGMAAAAGEADAVCTVNRVGSMLTPFLGVQRVADYGDARRADLAGFAALHRRWLDGGVFWPPSQFETGFLSAAHSNADIDRTVGLFAEAMRVPASEARTLAAVH